MKEFLQSKNAKLLLIVLIIFSAVAFGVWKQLENSGDKPKNTQQTQNENTQGELVLGGQAPIAELSENEMSALENTEDASSAKAYEIASNALMQDRISAAIEQYKISAESSDPEIKKNSLYKLIECYSKSNDTDNLIDNYEKLLEIETDKNIKKGIYEELGSQYDNKGVYNKAIESYKSSYEIEATANNAVKLCEIYSKIHDEQSIQNIANDFTAKNPGYEPLFNRFGINANNYQPQEAQSAPQEAQPAQQEETEEANPSEEENNQE